jgi:hypothetical protein
MIFKDIAVARLVRQQIASSDFKTAKELVHWMGAMQAQDYNMAKWAIGVRVPGSTNQTIEKAIEKAEIIRTHVLRPTWHFVSANDIHWMLDLTGPRIKASLKFRQKHLELTDKILAKSNKVIEKALTGGKHLTRDELTSKLENSKIQLGDQRAGHILLAAELDKVICSGATNGKKTTYALLEERVPDSSKLTREEALALLTSRYFTSHGPATVKDFMWWSGLTLSDVKKGLEIVKGDFISEKIEQQTYWFTNSSHFSGMSTESVYLLPAFDEFMISYKDRTACLTLQHSKRAVSVNGILWPIIVINGQVMGTWKRIRGNKKSTIETEFFRKRNPEITKDVRNQIAAASEKVVSFFS